MNAETLQVSHASEMANKLGWKGQTYNDGDVTATSNAQAKSNIAATCKINIYLFHNI